MSSVSYDNSYDNSEFTQTDGITLSDCCINQMQYQLLITSAKNYLCDRCRRFTAINRSQPCDQCLNVLSSQWS